MIRFFSARAPPRRDARNPFVFMIEQVDESGAIIGEAIGGCNNVIPLASARLVVLTT